MYNVSNMTEHTYPYDSSLTNLINTIHLIWTIPIYPSNGKSDWFLWWRSQQWVLEFVCRIFYLEKFTPHRWIAHNHATELMLCASHYSIYILFQCNLDAGPIYLEPFFLVQSTTPQLYWLTNTQTRGNVHLMITGTIPTFVDDVQNVKKSVHAFRVCLYLVHNSTVTAGYVKVLLWCSYPWLVHRVLVLGHVTCCKQY